MVFLQGFLNTVVFVSVTTFAIFVFAVLLWTNNCLLARYSVPSLEEYNTSEGQHSEARVLSVPDDRPAKYRRHAVSGCSTACDSST